MSAAETPQAAADAAATTRSLRAGGGVRGAWAARVGGLPTAFWRIWTGTLVNRLGTFVEPFLTLYLTTVRGLSVASTGVVIALYGAGSVLAQPAGGFLADRIGRRVTLAGSLAVSAVMLAALAAAHAVWLTVAVVVVLGVVGDAYRPASNAAVADLVPFSERRRATGLVFWAVNLGFSGAAVLGGLLAVAGYGLLFALDAATCAVFAAIVWRSVPETRPAAAIAAERAANPGGGYRTVLRDRTFVGFLLSQLLVALGFMQLFAVLPLAMDHDGLGPATYGIVIALNGLLIVALHPILAPALLRRDPARVMAVGAVLLAAGLGSFALADGAPVYAAGMLVFTLGEICNAATAPGLVAEIAPAALRGRYSGIYGLQFGVAGAIGPLLGTQLLGEGDAPWPWVAAGALGLVSAVAFTLLGPALGRRRAAAAPDG